MKIITIFSLVLIFNSCSNDPSPIKSDQEGKVLPAFNLLLMDSLNHINTSKIPDGQPFVVFLFSPYCPYCRAQTKQMLADIKNTVGIHYYFLSSFPFAPVKEYYKHFHMEDYANITFAQDPENDFGDYYKANAVPYMALYDKNKRLKKVYVGNVGTKVIKDNLLE